MRIILPISCTLALAFFTPAVRAAEWGDLTGQFVLSGEAPVPAAIPVAPGVVDESLVIGPGKGIKNIIVYLYLREGELPPEFHPAYGKAMFDSVELADLGARYEPHVVLLQTTQSLVVENKDAVARPTSIFFLDNPKAALIVPAKKGIAVPIAKPERLPMSVNSPARPWMSARLVVRDNPYLASTDESGRFTIKNVPVGARSFQFWHERCGFLQKELTQDGKPLSSPKGRPQIAMVPAGVDLGTIEVGIKAFK